MADNQIVKDFEKNDMRVEVKVSYSLGGVNYFTYKQEQRGYYLHVQPYEQQKGDGYSMRTITGFSGVKLLLVGVSRKSAKKLQEAVGMVTDEIIDKMLLQCKFE